MFTPKKKLPEGDPRSPERRMLERDAGSPEQECLRVMQDCLRETDGVRYVRRRCLRMKSPFEKSAENGKFEFQIMKDNKKINCGSSM